MKNPVLLLIVAHLLEVVTGQQYFRVKPHDTSVIAGRTAELHCHIGNRAGLVQWSKDGFLLGYDPDIPGYERYEMRVDHLKSAYTLLVHEARLDDEAEFQCQVGPGKNEKPIRSVARLTVLVPPKHLSINDLPNGSEIEVREAEKVVLKCQAISSKPATILKWYRKNVELMPEASRTTVRREGEKLYSTLSSITLYPKGDTSGSPYTCEALHPALEKPLKTTVDVGVLYPPRHPEIKGYREGSLIHAGDHLKLTCISTGGKPRAELEWYRNGEVIQGSFSSLGRDSSSTISFTVRSTDNNAVYTCAASNPLTPIPLVAAVKLAVIFPPNHVTVDGPSEGARGETITLNCRSDVSNPPSELTWLVDGISFEPQDSTSHPVENGWFTTSNLSAIITKQSKNFKVFTCIAQNSPRHEKVFQTFNVSVLYPPESPTITGYDDSSELREGDHQSFTCSALAGNPPADLRWYRGDTEVSSVTNLGMGHISSILTFEIEASDNEIVIRCEVNNSANMEPLSTEVKLSVLFPPQNVTISVEPLQPREGDTVKLECWTGSSNPVAYISWWKDGELYKDQHQSETTDSAFGGSSTRSKISVPVSLNDHRSRFTCEAKNEAFPRSAQEHVILNVFYAPVFVTSGKVVEMIEGRSGEVNITANAFPEVHSYRWSKSGGFIPRRTEDYRQIPSVTTDGAVLYFNHVSRHDSGAYTCVAQNVEGSASATLTLNVLYPATITNITSSIEVSEGETAQLECLVDGNPQTEGTIKWRRQDGRALSPTAQNAELGRSVLTISNVTKRDAGVVECVADNGIGRSSVSKAQIVVLYRPSILKNRLQHRIAAGERDSAELTCMAEGYPDINFAWSFNGSTITSGQSEPPPRHTVRERRKSPSEWWSILVVTSVGQGDYGVYTCIAENQLGHDFVAFSLVKRSIPDPPESVEALNVSHQGVLLVWAPGFDGGLTQSYQLKIQKNQQPPLTFLHIPINTTSYLLNDLEQGSLYEISIAAKNALGESLYSLPVSFRTKSLPVMDSTVSGQASGGNASGEFLPAWLLAAAVIGGLVVVANLLVCIIYIRRKRWCRNAQAAIGSPASDDEVSRQKIVKKIPSEDRSPFYLTGTSVDMPDDGLDVDTFQKAPSLKLHQVSRESSEDGQSSGRRCDCGGRQWSSTLICGGRAPGDERVGNQHEQCPDILKRDSCHCHSITSGGRLSEAEEEISSSLGAVMYGKKERALSSEPQDYMSREPPGAPQITLTTFQSKSELPIRHTIIGPKLETVINGHDEDS